MIHAPLAEQPLSPSTHLSNTLIEAPKSPSTSTQTSTQTSSQCPPATTRHLWQVRAGRVGFVAQGRRVASRNPDIQGPHHPLLHQHTTAPCSPSDKIPCHVGPRPQRCQRVPAKLSNLQGRGAIISLFTYGFYSPLLRSINSVIGGTVSQSSEQVSANRLIEQQCHGQLLHVRHI